MTDIGEPSLLDQAMPAWDHRERHSILVGASVSETWQKLQEARAADLRIARLLMWVRSGFRRPRLDEGRLIDTMPPREIAACPPREILMGFYYPSALSREQKLRLQGDQARARPASLAEFRADRPGWTKLALNFTLVAEGNCTRLSTETRALSRDRRARLRFAPYWFAIRLGSGLIRLEILKVIARTKVLAQATPVPASSSPTV